MKTSSVLVRLAVIALALAACAPAPTPNPTPVFSPPTAAPTAGEMEPTVRYTLVTGGGTGKLNFVGRGGDIDGQPNPTLTAQPGDVVEITLVNGDYILHDLAIDEFDVKTPQLPNLDETTQA